MWWTSPLRFGIGLIVTESALVKEQWPGLQVLEVELACCVVVTVTVAVIVDGCASVSVVVWTTVVEYW